MHRLVLCVLLLSFHAFGAEHTDSGVKKLRDIVVYKDARFYSSFPSIVRRPNGELLVAFRRAPNRSLMGSSGVSHTDANSYLELVRSTDDGKTWSQPEMLFAHPFGGSQDPCMVQLRDGTIVCTSYGWCLSSAKSQDLFSHGNFSFLGGFVLRSTDGGHHWQGPIEPPPTPGDSTKDVFGRTVPAYNRGAMCEGKDGRLYWVVASKRATDGVHTSVHLMISADKGKTWTYSCPIAADPKISFNETSLYETPKGDLVAFIRTEGFDDHTVIARSTDHGKTFQQWQDSGFQGHPHYALRLPDKRVLLVYGYRHAPFGVRARVLDAECTDWSGPEIVLRDDGTSGDLGYPWATMIGKDRALVVYYMHDHEDIGHIAGTILEIKPAH